MADYDVIVIGCGPAGQKAAIKCAKVGRKVALVDERQVVGGQCLHIGTIPSKTIRAAIIYLSGYYERKIYGESYRVKEQITAQDLLFRCHAIIRRELDVIHGHLDSNGVDILLGQAEFCDPHRIRVTSTVGTDEYTADYFVICTGSRPHYDELPPFDNVHVMSTDDILALQFIPERLVIAGGGVIGLEYACMFSLLGIEVSVVTRQKELLPWVDRELIEALMNHMHRHGVRFYFEDAITHVHVNRPRHVGVELTSGASLDVEMVLYAAVRWGNTPGLNLSAAGLSAGAKDCLKVNDDYQTSVPHIYAAGDVIGWPSLASTAIDQGRKAANRLLGVADVPYAPQFPYGIYTFPEISMVGASEEDLIRSGQPYLTGTGYYRDSARGQIMGDEDGLVKLLFDPDNRRLLGVHIIGSEATELIHLGQAVLLKGERIDFFLDTVFNYPTLAEVYKIAALNGFNRTEASLPHLQAL